MAIESPSATRTKAGAPAPEAGDGAASQPADGAASGAAEPPGGSRSRIAADAWIAHLREHLPIAREGTDPEGVHQLRIAAGRLDVWLRLGGMRVLRDDLRWLRRGAAGVRDLDVLLQRPQPAPFAHALEQARIEQRGVLERVLASPRLPALIDALSSLSPLRRKRALKGLGRETAKVLRRGKKAVASGAPEDVHALRRAARRLRYGREWLGLGSRALERLQDELGAMADAATLLRHLERCPAWDGAAELRSRAEAELERARDEGLRRFRKLARRLRAEV